MSKRDKLVERLLSNPKDFTFEEMSSVLNRFGYSQVKSGKASGSRVAFSNDERDYIRVHKPHPRSILKDIPSQKFNCRLERKGFVMINQLCYNGYIGTVFFSEEDSVFYGKVVGISDSISFEGDSAKSLTEDFHNAVDEYLEFCTNSGKQPEKSLFAVKISPDVYNKATLHATRNGLPLNLFVEKIIENNISA